MCSTSVLVDRNGFFVVVVFFCLFVFGGVVVVVFEQGQLYSRHKYS